MFIIPEDFNKYSTNLEYFTYCYSEMNVSGQIVHFQGEGLVLSDIINNFFLRKREAGTKAPLEGTVMKKKYDETNIETCPLVDVQKIIQSKWAIIVMYYLQDETLRFGELSRKTPQVTQANLTKVLRTLKEAGLVHREVYPVVPPKVEYSLTPIGQKFKIVLEALEVWSTEYVEF